jgi:cytochrome b
MFHWLLAASFFGAYVLSESEKLRHIHVMFGYTVLGLTAFRLLWGFIGTRYARFSSFLFGPKAVASHVGGLLHRKVDAHVGHTPAGSWAIYAMFILALLTGVSGYLNLNEIGGEGMEEVHEVVANLWMLVVCVHVAGVIVSSFVERQNLPRSMVTGYKQLDPSATGIAKSQSMIGLVVLLVVAAFWGITWQSGGANLGVDVNAQADSTASSGEYRLSHDKDRDDD